jgi:hypothetical protein
MHGACQHRRRCGLDENGCRLVNGEAAQMDMAWRLLDLKPSKLVEIHIFWGDFKFKHCSFSTFQAYFVDLGGGSQLIKS